MKHNISVGFLLNAIYSDYCSELRKGVEKFCNKQAVAVKFFPVSFIVDSDEDSFSHQFETVCSFINSNNIDVLIISTASFQGYKNSPAFLEKIGKIPGIKKISIGLPMFDAPTVSCESNKCIEALVEHMVKDHGRKKFLLMAANKTHPESIERQTAFFKSLKKLGVEFDINHLLYGSFIFLQAEKVLKKYIEENGVDFDSIFCLNDNMAAGCIKCLKDMNIKIPEEVTVTGFDNIIESYNY